MGRPLLARLERYLDEQLATSFHTEDPGTSLRRSIAVEDAVGIEVVHAAADYGPDLFPDTVRQVSFETEYWESRERNARVRLRFHRDRLLSEVTMDWAAPSARESVVGVRDGIRRLLHPHATPAWLFHPSKNFPAGAVAAGALLGAGTTSVLHLAFGQSPALASTQWAVGVAAGCYWAIGRFLFPYTTFDSRRWRRVRAARNWVALGLLGFVVFGVAMTELRRHLGL